MVVAANFAFSQIKSNEKEVPSPHYSPQPIIPKEEIIEELDQEEMIKKNEEILATPKEDIYKEKEVKQPPPKQTRPGGYWF